jgi:hypothetical protein
MYPSSALLGQNKDEATASIPVEELIEKADGFAGVFPGEHAHRNYTAVVISVDGLFSLDVASF